MPLPMLVLEYGEYSRLNVDRLLGLMRDLLLDLAYMLLVITFSALLLMGYVSLPPPSFVYSYLDL